jgi:hypothetical protein
VDRLDVGRGVVPPPPSAAELVEAAAEDDAVQPRRLVRLVRESRRQPPIRLEVRLLDHVVQAVALDQPRRRAPQPRVVALHDPLEAAARAGVEARRRRPRGGGEPLGQVGDLAAHLAIDTSATARSIDGYGPLTEVQLAAR